MATGSALTRRTVETKQSKRSGKSVSSRGSKRQDICEHHRYGKLDLFCVDHQCLICGMCREDEHDSCSNVIQVHQAANGFSQTDSAANWDKLLRQLLTQCTSVVDERRKDQKELNKTKAEIELYVKNYRQSLVNKLDKLVQQILADVGRLYSKENRKIQNNISELAKNIKILEDKLADIELAKAVSVDLPLFLTVQNAIQKHKTIKSKLSNIHDEAHRVSLKLRQSDVQITNLTIGDVEVEKKSYDILPRPVVKIKPALKESRIRIDGDSKIRLIGNVEIRIHGEGRPCITSICTFLDNFIVVADYENNNLKLLSPEFKLVYTLPLLYPPFAITATSDTSIAVTSPETNEIHLVKVHDRRALEQTGSIKLSYDCYGLDILDSIFFITSLSNKCVNATDMNGEEKWTVKLDHRGEQLFIWPWYVAAHKRNNLVYISDRNRNTITEIQSNGSYLRTIEMSDYGPRGIVTDGKDNLLVCCFLKDSIVKLSTGIFEERSPIGTKRDDIKHPQCVALLNGQPRFILSSYKSDKLTEYEFLN